MNKFVILSVFALLTVDLVAFAIRYTGFSNETSEYVLEIALGVARLAGICIMLASGSLYGSGFWKVIVAFAVLILFGACIKILHYDLAPDTLITVGFAGILFTYVLHFIQKPIKGHLDFLKLLWVFSFSCVAVIIILHYVPRELSTEVSMVDDVIFWITFADFAYLELLQNKNG